MRCDFCKATNPTGVTQCQVCGARLSAVVCDRCYFENPPDHTFCGQCGQALTPTQAPSSQRGSVIEFKPVPVVAIVGFGAILAIASVAFPWYFLGDQSSTEATPITISTLLDIGWNWFPGVPLLLIMVSAALSTFLTILGSHGKPHPVLTVLLGLASLASALWLWQGMVAAQPNLGNEELTPMLATIGAIIVLVGGSMTARALLAR